MHKQQLEQVQLQQQQVNSSTAATPAHVSPCSSPADGDASASRWSNWVLLFSTLQSLAHTLDQAKAQFAASALVTIDQLLALKTKEELGPGGGVNGVLSPSGTAPVLSTLLLCLQPVLNSAREYVIKKNPTDFEKSTKMKLLRCSDSGHTRSPGWRSRCSRRSREPAPSPRKCSGRRI